VAALIELVGSWLCRAGPWSFGASPQEADRIRSSTLNAIQKYGRQGEGGRGAASAETMAGLASEVAAGELHS